MTRRHRLAFRLWFGSSELARRIGARTAAWIARGRRDDLTGWRAALGCWLRFGLIIAALWFLWKIVRGVPVILWFLVPAWCVAAVRTAPPYEAQEEGEEGAPAAPEPDTRATLVYWLDTLTQERSGIHLGELHQYLTRDPALSHLTRAEIRPWLEGHGIAVDRTLRVGSVAGRTGVARATIEALLKTLPPLPERAPSPASESGSDLRKSPHSPADLHAWRGAVDASERDAS